MTSHVELAERSGPTKNDPMVGPGPLGANCFAQARTMFVRDFLGHLLRISTSLKLGRTSALVLLNFLLFANASSQIKRLQESQPRAELVVQTGHSLPVRSVVFSPDGRTVADGGFDSTIKLWNVDSGREVRTLAGHSDAINGVAFSPNGKTLASGSSDGTIKLWEVATGKELVTLVGHSDLVATVAFSSDGQTVASGSWDKTIRIWSVQSGRTLHTLNGHSEYVASVVISADGKNLASAGLDGTVRVWDMATAREVKKISLPSGANALAFSPDGRILASGNDDKSIALWEVATGKNLGNLSSSSGVANSIAISPNGLNLASGNADGVEFWNLGTGKLIRTLNRSAVSSVAFSPDGRILAIGDDTAIKLLDSESGRDLQTFSGEADLVTAVAFSADGKVLASGNNDLVNLWDLRTGNGPIERFRLDDGIYSLAFAPDGQMLAGGGFGVIKLWDIKSGTVSHTIDGHESFVNSVAFSGDGTTLASCSGAVLHQVNEIKLWDVKTGQEVKTLARQPGPVFVVAFGVDGKSLVSGGWDKGQTKKRVTIWDVKSGTTKEILEYDAPATKIKVREQFPRAYEDIYGDASSGLIVARIEENEKIKLLDRKTGKELCSLIALNDGEWVVTTSEGRFDTNKDLSNINGLHWVVSDDPLTPVPLEIFMRDYYEPRLLPRLLKCTEDNNCELTFPPIPNIADLNRVQPEVRISNVSPPDAAGKAVVTVEVGNGKVPAAECKMKRCETGAYDLRIFRDGQLVGSFPADTQDKLVAQEQAVAGQEVGPNDSAQRKQAWRTASAVPLAPKPGKRAITFEVQLPRNQKLADVEFTAYAFNEDRVKSKTSSFRWTADQVAKLSAMARVKPRAYVISVGVNAYENASFNLSYAANDARRFQEELTGRLGATGQYSEVVPVALISDWELRGGQTTQRGATKANFKAVLDRLAGKSASVPAGPLADIPNAEKLRKATPDDVVLILFSSHGFADKNGQFYFIPYDTGPGACKVFTSTVRQHSISSDELSLWMRDVDAGQMAMIIDACQSSAAVEGAGFKPGPMGSRGLGQLAYDKSMMILTATQADNIATENPSLQQGVLSYALLQNGLRFGQADFKPKDQTITLKEWFTFARDDVPKLFARINAPKPGKNVGVGAQPLWIVRQLTVTGGGCPTASASDAGELRIPEPGLFDFSRKRNDVRLTVGQ